MSLVADWQMEGTHKNGEPLSGEELRELIALNPDELEDAQLEADSEWIGEWTTFSIGAYERTLHAVEEFAAAHPDIMLKVVYRYENAWFPDGFVADDGRVRQITGRITYTYDDNGEEFK